MEPIRSKNMVMSSSAIEGQSSTDTCQRLICLMLALGSDSGVDLDGGGVSDRIVRGPVCTILLQSSQGWGVSTPGRTPRRFRGPNPDHDVCAPLQICPSSSPTAVRCSTRSRPHGLTPADLAVAVSHLHLDHSGGLRHLAEAGVEVCIHAVT